jgi:hypothetical protein
LLKEVGIEAGIHALEEISKRLAWQWAKKATPIATVVTLTHAAFEVVKCHVECWCPNE